MDLKKLPLKLHLAISLFTILGMLVISVYLVNRGVIWSPDGVIFSERSDLLLEVNYNYLAYATSAQDTLKGQSLLYLIPITVMAITKDFFGSAWPNFYVAINGLLILVALLANFVMISRVTGSKIYGTIGIGFFLIHYDSWFWVSYLQSDIYLFLIASLTFITMLSQQTTGWKSVTLTLCFLGLLFSKTHGLVLVGTAIGLILFFHLSPKNWQGLLERSVIPLTALTAIGILATSSYFMSLPEGGAKSTAQTIFSYAKNFFDHGIIMVGRPEINHAPPQEFFDYFMISMDRFVTFFKFIAAGWSFGHKVFSAAFFIPLYGFCLVSFALFYGNKLNDQERRFVVMAACMIIMMVGFCAATVIDYSWRYRLPCIPLFLGLAAIGLKHTLRLTMNLQSVPKPST